MNEEVLKDDASSKFTAKRLQVDERKQILAVVEETLSKEVDNRIDNRVKIEIEKLRETLTASSISTLGIFASIVTFLLVEIQILKNICDFSKLLGFSSFILGALLSFIVILQHIIGSNKRTTQRQSTFLILLLLFLFGFSIFSMYRSSDEFTCKLTHLNEEFEKLGVNLEKKQSISIININDRLKKIETELNKQ